MDLPSVLRDTTALCWAAGTGNVDMLRQLLDDGVDVNLADYDQRTPLHIAASDGKADIVEMLLRAGANVYKKDRWGVTPLDCAKDAAIVTLMAQHVRANLLGESNATFRRTESLDETHEPICRKSVEDIHALFCAIGAGDTEALKRAWLDGVKLDAVDSTGRTALHVAVEKEQLNAIELILSAGAAVDVVDHHGRTAMSIAVEMGSSNVVNLFRRHIYAHSQSPRTNDVPLAFDAVQRGDVPRLQQLVPKTVHPDVQDYDSRSLLHVAASEGLLPVVQYLVACGANVNALDRWGNSPLSEALYFAHNKVAKYLRAHHGSEHGHPLNESTPNQLDAPLLNAAFEHILRTVCRDKWYFGEVFLPIQEANVGCSIVLHSVWFRRRTPSFNEEHDGNVTVAVPSMASSTGPLHPITFFRKARGLMLLDPGQDHVGRVYSGQQPEWIANLHTTSQSKFFFAPHARKAGLKAVVSVPMMHKMSLVAILSWYATEPHAEDAAEIHRIQRLVKSVSLLCGLRPETMSRFQYCQVVENACTGHGELLAADIGPSDVVVHDVLSLALSWQLFDFVSKLATSMSSEDHLAVVDLLGALVALVERGFFDDVVEGIDPLAHEDVEVPIETKLHLLRHLVYVLAFLTSTSPTEGDVFTKCHGFQHRLRRHAQRRGNEAIEDEPMEEILNESTELDAPSLAVECVLCKFNVSGHIHPGAKTPLVVTEPPPKRTADTRPSLFLRIPSPVFREFRQLPSVFADEWARFPHKAKLVKQDSYRLTRWSTSDLYDTVGASHDRRSIFTAKTGLADQGNVLGAMNAILEDATAVVTFDQVKALHEAVFEDASGGGTIREDAAVGYASERIYRVFLPAVEIDAALEEYVQTLNSPTAFPHPLLRAYYAFSALVFFIHPFYDGNGRCARLLGNIIARKSGFPHVIRHLDKTIQLASFLETTLNTLALHEEAQKNRRSRLVGKNTSTWF
ncbi:Aste57867_19450 [Aphanomyces stellatus]|uniref:Aste57867_19450 protein n=1 Tax=Aphanomyces stellatus TaxID=120398 RepID=A0A485LE94_9STRA|nr:hypothetical protein As57867_019386 [Aphanomyces stellatus]VFT96163.1 Aste57867_19450 [Aphanomyces stellatus]